MDRISLVTPRNDLSQEPTTTRPTPRSGPAFKDVVSRSAGTLVEQARSMMTKLPGGPVLAAAVRGTPAMQLGAGPSMSGHGFDPAAPATSPPAGTTTAKVTATMPAEGPGAPVEGNTPGIEATIQSSQDMNLYYLQLQEAMAAENRSYSASSNVLKARHDTVKNAIGNIR